MAIVVERASALIDSPSSTGTGAFTGTPSTGNNVIVTAWGYWSGNATLMSLAVSDDATGEVNVYGTDQEDTTSNSGSNSCGIARSILTTTKSGLAVTIGFGGGVVAGGAIEVSGLVYPSPVDVAPAIIDSTSPFTASSGTLAQANEIIVASFCFESTAAGSYSLTANAWSGATPTTHFVNDGPSISSEYGIGASLIVNSTSARTLSFSSTDNGTGGKIVAVSYKGAGAGGGGGTPLMGQVMT